MYLEINKPEGERTHVNLEGFEKVILGRDKTCDVVLRDSCIARRHFAINISEDKVIVEDHRTTNGVYVNGEIVDCTAEVNVGDTIQVGSHNLRLVEDMES